MVQYGEPYIAGTISKGFADDGEFLGSKITGVLSPISQLTGSITTGLKARPYEGPYLVTPLPDISQQLNTKNKLSEDNIIVKPIPFIKVNADDGGEIAIIGKEV